MLIFNYRFLKKKCFILLYFFINSLVNHVAMSLSFFDFVVLAVAILLARLIHPSVVPSNDSFVFFLFQENILLRQRGQSAIKVIDFGSSCYEHQKGISINIYPPIKLKQWAIFELSFKTSSRTCGTHIRVTGFARRLVLK